MRILHIIPGLFACGAETVLFNLLKALRGSEVEATVVSMTGPGDHGPAIEAMGIPLVCLGMCWAKPDPAGLWRLRRCVRHMSPDLIQGWMYYGNLAALGARWQAGGRVPVLWNVRHSLDDLSRERFSLRIMLAAGRQCSGKTAGIIYNSRRSARQHEEYGYAADRSIIIPNGFDTGIFRPSVEDRETMRQELGAAADEFVIGLIARFDPVKGHDVFLKAAVRFAARQSRVRFVLAGRGIDSRNLELTAQVSASGLADRIILAGERRDLPRFLNGLDLVTIASHTEAFPNVLGEAMACGIPCVTTDVGDAAWLVGAAGRVVPPGDAQALATAWEELARMSQEERAEVGQAARARVLKDFTLEAAAGRYLELYRELAGTMRRRG